MRKAASHLKAALSLERYPFASQQRSLIVPKAAGKIISELYRTKKRFMSDMPLYVCKCALYADYGIDKADLQSLEFSAALKDLYYTTLMPWAGASSDETRSASKTFVYAKVYDAVKRARTKKARAETEAEMIETAR